MQIFQEIFTHNQVSEEAKQFFQTRSHLVEEKSTWNSVSLYLQHLPEEYAAYIDGFMPKITIDFDKSSKLRAEIIQKKHHLDNFLKECIRDLNVDGLKQDLSMIPRSTVQVLDASIHLDTSKYVIEENLKTLREILFDNQFSTTKIDFYKDEVLFFKLKKEIKAQMKHRTHEKDSWPELNQKFGREKGERVNKVRRHIRLLSHNSLVLIQISKKLLEMMFIQTKTQNDVFNQEFPIYSYKYWDKIPDFIETIEWLDPVFKEIFQDLLDKVMSYLNIAQDNFRETIRVEFLQICEFLRNSQEQSEFIGFDKIHSYCSSLKSVNDYIPKVKEEEKLSRSPCIINKGLLELIENVESPKLNFLLYEKAKNAAGVFNHDYICQFLIHVLKTESIWINFY